MRSDRFPTPSRRSFATSSSRSRVLRSTASRAERKNSNASSTWPSPSRACADSRICRSAEGSQAAARWGLEHPGDVSLASLIELSSRSAPQPLAQGFPVVVAEFQHRLPHPAPGFHGFPRFSFMAARHVHRSGSPLSIPVAQVKVGTMTTLRVLMAAASQQDLDQAPLDGVLAQSLQLREEFGYASFPRNHKSSRLPAEDPLVKHFFGFFVFFLLRGRAPASGGVAPLALRTPSRVRAPVPTGAAPRPSQIQTFQHQSKLGRVDLDVTSPGRRLRREGKRPALQPLVQKDVPGSVPHQDLDPVLPLVQEAEKVATERVTEQAPRRGRQTVKTAPQVDWFRRDVDPDRGRQRQHDTLPSRTSSTRTRSSTLKP